MSDNRANQDEISGPENDLREQNPGQTTTGDFGDNDDAADQDLQNDDLDDEPIEDPGAT